MTEQGKMAKQEHIVKKTWKKPELQVLSRGESEENVLAGCKASLLGDLGPQGSGRCNWIYACQESTWS